MGSHGRKQETRIKCDSLVTLNVLLPDTGTLEEAVSREMYMREEGGGGSEVMKLVGWLVGLGQLRTYTGRSDLSRNPVARIPSGVSAGTEVICVSRRAIRRVVQELKSLFYRLDEVDHS